MNSNQEISGLILEGISGTGKTALLQSICKNPNLLFKDSLSCLILTEHHTQRIFENLHKCGTLTKSLHLVLLNEILDFILMRKKYLDSMDWCDKSMTQQNLNVILERFHLSHVNIYPHLEWNDVQEIDDKFAELNFTLCLLTIDSDSIAERLIEQRRNIPTWMTYISNLGKSEKEIVNYFVNMQNELLELYEKSKMKKVLIDCSAETIEDTIKMFLK
jgi:thymidylate kinase